MSLNTPNTAFESQDSTDAAATQAAAAETVVKTEVQAEQSTNTALAPAASSALAAPRAGSPKELLAQSNVLGALQEALPVTWEDFQAINASQGQFQIKGGESAVQIGKEIELLLVSYQPQWVSAPKDNDAEGDDLVRYSDDGVNLNDDSGRTIKEHQAMLSDKGEEPTLSHRVVLVGELLKCDEAGMDEVGNLVQVVLAESGRRNFESHCKQVAYQIANGRMREGDAQHLKLTAALAGSGKKQYTLVKVGYREGHGPNRAGADIIA